MILIVFDSNWFPWFDRMGKYIYKLIQNREILFPTAPFNNNANEKQSSQNSNSSNNNNIYPITNSCYLPNDIVQLVFNYLPLHDLLICTQVCKLWKSLASDIHHLTLSKDTYNLAIRYIYLFFL